MKKMTWYQMTNLFRDYNKHAQSKTPIVGFIVFTPESFQKPYTLEERTYRVSSDCNWFNKRISTSLYGDCLDGTDHGVRLDAYMKDFGNRDGWIVAECYVEDSTMETILSVMDKEEPMMNKQEPMMEKQELELNQRQIERIDELHNAVYDLCVLFTENPDLEWDMYYIGEIADQITDILVEYGERVHYPAIERGYDGNDRIIEWEE